MRMFDDVQIQKYAKKNTSPRFPLEEKYVYAYLQSMLNSKDMNEMYKILMDECQSGDTFWFYNSFWKDAGLVNREPYRSIVAYSMLKKDIRLFELISASLFTGTVQEYHGSDLYNEVVQYTDELPTHYTDEGIYTDMQEGLVQIAFKNWFCDDPLPDGTGSEYQTLEELEKAIKDFDAIITMTKPARVIVLLFYQRYCYLSGDRLTVNSCGIDTSSDSFICPFGPISESEPNTSMDVIDNMSDNELIQCYNTCSMSKGLDDMNLTFEREITVGSDYLMFRYLFRTQASEQGIWGDIKIRSNTSSTVYVIEKAYQEGLDHSQKYIPVCLKINDGPGDAILAFQVENGIPTVGALFYERQKI